MSTAYKVIVNGQQQLTVDSSQGTLLEAMEAAGLEPHYHCRNGFCGACRVQLVQGDITYINEPLAFVRPGDCLPCCCVAASDLEINQ
ncbi:MULTISPECIES: class I ribonucleotide reductase maintenance protein YfaE [Idiomarinaceae]|uniref:Ferredoxin n=3 Tax=Pseudidiomarina TaxID=2800384 RepID=A0A368V1L3_9GAMM|nr:MULTISPECIES: class I ribonucleotide reductase maintenance protein YfaE [Idiomarinaceae]MRJ40715.1 2Fe-2S ferredoxin-like protein [Idiomarina sp. FeN1]NCU56519.1 2Fe-2S ferredoxin-like protein [Idiomarina sp. FenA--70]NCU58899.1 2Fe-2S ferredoxin-like protein [Idiomarina sp. FenBw--71]PWW15038.1 ferredoxin [Pseudidiomarina maritima]RBP91582.1 ferredoxin [Pseudidiomarina tainanensis]